MITFILASIYSDVRGEGAGPLLPPVFAIVHTRLRDEAEGMDDERGTLDT